MKKAITLIAVRIVPIYICFLILSAFSKEDFVFIGFENDPAATSIAKCVIALIMAFAIAIYNIYVLLWCSRLPKVFNGKDNSLIAKYLLYAACQVGIFIIAFYTFGLYRGLIIAHAVTFNVTTIISKGTPSLRLPNAIKEFRLWIDK